MEDFLAQISLDNIKNYFLTNQQEELCGVINDKFKFIPCKNISPKPSEYFVIDGRETLNYNILGVAHSHVNDLCEFSPNDIDNALSNEIFSILYNVKEGKFLIYDYSAKTSRVIN